MKKHKELRERGEHMDQFISTFETKSKELQEKINDMQNKIINALEHITCTITDLNFEDIDNIELDSSQQTSIESLNKKCDIVTAQIERVDKSLIKKF